MFIQTKKKASWYMQDYKFLVYNFTKAAATKKKSYK